MPKKKEKKVSYYDLFNENLLLYYRKNPIDFIEDYIFNERALKHGGKLFLDDNQKLIVNEIFSNNKVSIRSFMGAGKTSSASWAALAFSCLYPLNCKVFITGTSFSQLSITIWAELRMWLNRSLLSGIYKDGAESIVLKEFETENCITLRTAKTVEGVRGMHATNMLIIADEASGIPDDILYALENTLTGGLNNKILLISNPTRNVGFFSLTQKDDLFKQQWRSFKLSVEDSKLIDKQLWERKRIQLGENSNIFRVDFMGEFPIDDESSIFSVEEITNAMTREVIEGSPISIGVDVARQGNDNSVIAVLVGKKILPLYVFSKLDYVSLANKIIDIVKELRIKYGYSDVIKVKIDASFQNYALYDILMTDTENNIEPIAVDFGDRKTKNDRYYDTITEAWFDLKAIINEIALPDDYLLKEELLVRKAYYQEESSKIKIEKKDKVKEMLNRSPDRADAVMLAIYEKDCLRYIFINYNVITNNVLPSLTADILNNKKIAGLYYSTQGIYNLLLGTCNGLNIYILYEYRSSNIIEVVRLMKNWCKEIYCNIDEKQELYNILTTQYGCNIIYRNTDTLDCYEKFKTEIYKKNIQIFNKCVKTIKQISELKSDISLNKMGIESPFILCVMLMLQDRKKNVIFNTTSMDYSKYLIKTDKQGNPYSWIADGI